MIVDALINADMAWDNWISKAQENVEDYIELDDTIIKRIEWDKNRSPHMKKAKDILRRLRNRDLYKFCSEFIVPPERIPQYTNISAEDISTCQDTNSEINLVPDDIIVHNMKIDWGMKVQNPVDFVHFYADYDSNDKFSIPKSQVSSLYTDTFIQRSVRVFSRNSDQKYVEAIATAFDNYQRRNYGTDVVQQYSTPIKGSSSRKRQCVREPLLDENRQLDEPSPTNECLTTL